MRAKLIEKYYDKHQPDLIFMDYEYRGHVYTVYENRAKGSEPLSWQHKIAQSKIDTLIKNEKNESKKMHCYEDTAEYGFNLFWDMVEKGE